MKTSVPLAVRQTRLGGLDLARYFAFVGMVIVNFKVAMGVDSSSYGQTYVLGVLTEALEGRAAATFVVLAGVGLGLAAYRTDRTQTIVVTLKRATFLLVVGLLNATIFEADILHYYAVYFLLGVSCLPLSNRALVGLVVAANVLFVGLLFALDYNTGWDWATLSYSGFWTVNGFIRNLFFNGWHPVFPWVSFLLFGILLSRGPLSERWMQNRMIGIGLVVFVANAAVSKWFVQMFSGVDAELGALFATAPIPPVPLYIIAGLSIASFVIGLCLRTSEWFRAVGVLAAVTPAGRQTLTLYIAHILIGMGTLKALDLLGGQSLGIAVVCALVFCALATIASYLWAQRFKRGAIEALMRAVAG